jgi:hypothetical protein
VSVQIRMDASDALHELQRLVDGPDLDDLLRFERIMTDQFQVSQQVVHVITGSLKLSGHQDSTWHDHTWTGEITYGGQSLGPINPVDYALYEYERGSAGQNRIYGRMYPHGTVSEPHKGPGYWNTDHSAFIDILPAQDAAYGEAMLAFLRGDRD